MKTLLYWALTSLLLTSIGSSVLADPFRPHPKALQSPLQEDLPLEIEPLSLNLIKRQNERMEAMINGQMLIKGSQIFDYKVADIATDRVTLIKDDEQLILYLFQ